MIDKYFSFFIKPKFQKYINSIVDEEVIKSNKMLLDIKREDIKKEKSVIYNILKDKIENIKSADDYNYSLISREIHDKVFKKLQPQFLYYFNISKDGEVKTKYNCHINSIISRVMIDISNNRIKF